jgi:glycosyltransferase involved in cell wall biosynthesis
MSAFDKVAHLLPYDLHIVVTPAKRFWADIVSAHQSLRTKARVHLLSFLSQDELRAEYASATVFVYPSQHEGFGIPILEAMSYGVPVVAGRVASIPEVAGDAAYYCDTADEGALAHTLVTVCMDTALRSRLIALGEARITLFSWERTASLVASACEDAMRLSRNRGSRVRTA